MSQLSIFDAPPALHTSDRPGFTHRDADKTEVAGAFAAMKGRGKRQHLMLEALFKAGPSGLTDYQLEKRTNMLPGSITSCRNNLEAMGLVEDAPFTRPGRVGTPVRVRRLTDKGRREFRRAS